MNQNKEKNKTGRGFYTTSQLKRVDLNRYKELIKVVPKLKEQDVISDISRLTERSPATIRRIINNGCVSPKKTKVFKPRFDYNNSDYDKIDSIITDFNKNKILPSINDVFSKKVYISF
jgi:hypothetical protein